MCQCKYQASLVSGFSLGVSARKTERFRVILLDTQRAVSGLTVLKHFLFSVKCISVLVPSEHCGAWGPLNPSLE